MASSGPYASLHLAPDRLPRQHPTAQFFTGRMPFLPPNQQSQSAEGKYRVQSVLEKSLKMLKFESGRKQIRCLKVLENRWKVLEFKSCKFWNFAFVDNFEASRQTNWWRQSVACFYHYGIGEYSTVHFSVTLQSKFWMSASRVSLFVDNFGAWKMQFGSLKSLKSAWILYFEFAMNPVSSFRA